MWWLAVIPFAAQMILMTFDEVHFHYKRGLPLWERIGHPLDTLSVLICFGFVLASPFSEFNLKIYCALALFSCLMVTKDEFVHKHHCAGMEHWLHACLFILHPIVLTMTGIIWPIIQGIQNTFWLLSWLDNPTALMWFMYIQTGAIAAFLLYQIVYWNFIWRGRPLCQ